MKKCTNCGTEYKEKDALFCEKCGSRLVEVEETAADTGEETENSKMYTGNAEKVKRAVHPKTSGTGKKKKIIIGSLAGVGVLILAGSAVMMFGKTKINLNDYTEIVVEGYDSVGTAYASFDIYKMLQDNSDVFGADPSRFIRFDGTEASLDSIIRGYFRLSVDETENLSNGDKVVAKWDISEYALEEFGERYEVKFTYKDVKKKVKELEEVKKVDVFEEINLSYEGYDGGGYATVAVKDDAEDYVSDYDGIAFDIQGVDGMENGMLSNGDKVTVTIADYDEEKKEYLARLYGIEPEELSQEFEVKGLKDMEEFDPFEKLEVGISGKSPFLELTLENHNTMEGLVFVADRTSNLAVGDEIVVTVEHEWGEDVEELCRDNGMKITETSHTYQVGDSDEYILSLDEIPEDVMNKLDKAARRILNEHADDYIGRELDSSEVTFIGNHFLKRKEPVEDNVAFVRFVYEISGNTVGDSKPFYTTVRFNNLIRLKDGTVSVDTQDYGRPELWVNNTMLGYKDMDSMFYHAITDFTDNYDYVSTVEG